MNRKLAFVILAILVFSVCCASTDYSANPTSNKSFNNTSVGDHSVVEDNGKYYVDMNKTGMAFKNETVIVEKSVDTMSIVAKPSCGCNYREPHKYKYKWYERTFVNYCPKCGKHGTLRNVHKPTARYEYELTCDMKLGGCDADYCGVCGKDKFRWSHYYIKLVD